MLPGIAGNAGASGLTPRSTLREIVHALGLQARIKVILDAGDKASYSGSGNTWTDLSGNGYDFVRAFTAPAVAGPTFSGTAGNQSSSENWTASTYYSYLEYETSNATWMNAVHKNNGKFTGAGWFDLTSADTFALVDTSGGNPASIGFAWGSHLIGAPTTTLEFVCHNGTGSLAGSASSGLVPTTTGFTFLAVAVDEAAGTWVMQSGATQASGAISYTSPSASNSTLKLSTTCGARSAGSGQLGELAMADVALTAAELTSLYNATKGRF